MIFGALKSRKSRVFNPHNAKPQFSNADVIADVIGQQVHLDVIVTISDVIVRALCQN